MKKNVWLPATAIAVVAGLTLYVGLNVGPRAILDTTVEYVGFMTVDTKKVLSATVESLKSESRLVSYSFVGLQSVSTRRERWYVFHGDQQLIVPATVSYFVDLSTFDISNVRLNESTKTVTVVLPKLMLSVGLDPRRTTMINSGVLTLSDAVTQGLEKLNYETATKSAISQGQQAEFVGLAKARTRENIERLFQAPLRVAGQTDVKVVVKFPGEPG